MRGWVLGWLCVALVACGAAAGCGGEEVADAGCAPGAKESCVCEDGTASARLCSEDGVFEECFCGLLPLDDCEFDQDGCAGGMTCHRYKEEHTGDFRYECLQLCVESPWCYGGTCIYDTSRFVQRCDDFVPACLLGGPFRDAGFTCPPGP